MENNKPLSEILSDFLERELDEVKKIISTISLRDLVRVVNAIDVNDKETAFKIYSGYSL